MPKSIEPPIARVINLHNDISVQTWIDAYTEAANQCLQRARQYRKRGMPLTAQLEEQDARIRKSYVMWLKHRLT